MESGNTPVTFSQVVAEYTPYVYNVAYRILGSSEDSQDVSQEVFLKIHRSWDKLDSTKSLKNWVCTITINACRDYHRSRKKHLHLEMDEERIAVESGIGAGDRADDRLFVKEILKDLDFKYRSVLVLFYLERQSIREIAATLKKPEVLVKVWLCRARKLVLQKHGKIV